MELLRRVPAFVAVGAGAISACFVHGVGPPRSGVCGGRGRGDIGLFCAWSWSAAFRRVWRKGTGRFRLVLCSELVRRVPAVVAEGDGAIPACFVHGVGPPRCGVCGGTGRGDSGSFCAWSCSAALWRVWRNGTGRFRLVLCMELVCRVPACVAEGGGAIPARFVHGVAPPRCGVCGGTGRAISACFVHGVGPPRCGVCGGRGRGDIGLFCAWSWSAAFRRLWRNGTGDSIQVGQPVRLPRCGASVGGFRGFALLRLVALLGGVPAFAGMTGWGAGMTGGGFWGFCVTEVGCAPGWGSRLRGNDGWGAGVTG